MTHVGSFYHELSKVSLSTSVCQFCRSDQDCERSLEDMNFGRLRANAGQLEYPQRALFHLCCLRGRLIKHSVKFSPAMLPSHLDGFPHRTAVNRGLHPGATIKTWQPYGTSTPTKVSVPCRRNSLPVNVL